MSEFFVVWLTTAGAFGFTGTATLAQACNKAGEWKQAQVFRLVDPGSRYAMMCSSPWCDFPGWVTVLVPCVWKPEAQDSIPGHWEAR